MEHIERLEALMINDARRFGHHGIANLIETIRQRHKVKITPGRARDLLRKAGFPDPRP